MFYSFIHDLFISVFVVIIIIIIIIIFFFCTR